MDSFYVVEIVMGVCVVGCGALFGAVALVQHRQRKAFQPKAYQPIPVGEIDPNHPWVKMIENQFGKAVEEAIAEHHRQGRSVTVVRDGETLILSPENKEV